MENYFILCMVIMGALTLVSFLNMGIILPLVEEIAYLYFGKAILFKQEKKNYNKEKLLNNSHYSKNQALIINKEKAIKNTLFIKKDNKTKKILRVSNRINLK